MFLLHTLSDNPWPSDQASLAGLCICLRGMFTANCVASPVPGPVVYHGPVYHSLLEDGDGGALSAHELVKVHARRAEGLFVLGPCAYQPSFVINTYSGAKPRAC